MKKFLKPLVIATSVAAVVGIGAVSFAAWEGTKSQTANGTTATITAIGLDSVTAPTTKLLPYDQPGTPASTDAKMWDIKLSTLGDTTVYDLKGKVDVTAASGKTWAGTVRVLIDTNATATAPADDTAAGSWGTALSSTATVLQSAPAADTDYYAHVILVSTDATNDMGATLAFTFELA